MSCNNCFNNCTEVYSDRCVRYTGEDVITLGITNGDNLLTVEQAIITKLLTVIDGSGIFPVIDSEVLCTTITDRLPVTPISIVGYLNTLIESLCYTQSEITILQEWNTALEAEYTIPTSCFTEYFNVLSTHDVLQAVVNKLCEVNLTANDLYNLIDTNYSANGDQLDAYIANYLATNNTGTTLQSNKMVPYVAYEFYGSLSGKFDANGVGLVGTDWVNIYICNGQNGTPDKRGRVAVGATDSPGPAITDPVINPAISGNPIYSAAIPGSWTENGANSIILNSTQVPNHDHLATAVVTSTSHFHYTFNNVSSEGTGSPGVTSSTYPTVNLEVADTLSYRIKGSSTVASLGKTSGVSDTPAINITITPTSGGGSGHSNIQPSIAAYYIMYIP